MSTTDTTSALRRPPSAVGRIVSIVKLHFTNPATILTVPLTVLGLIFLLNWFIWWILAASAAGAERADAGPGLQWTGASFFVFVYMLVVAVQAMNFTFPYALGLGVTRRDFSLGSGLTFVLLSAGWSILLTGLAAVERATDGWGLDGRMFTAVYFGDGATLQHLWITFVLFLFFFFTGTIFAAVYVRWRQYGLFGMFALVAVLGVAAFGTIALTDSWASIGAFLTDLGWAGGYSLLLVPTAISGIVGFTLLRRATPRG